MIGRQELEDLRNDLQAKVEEADAFWKFIKRAELVHIPDEIQRERLAKKYKRGLKNEN